MKFEIGEYNEDLPWKIVTDHTVRSIPAVSVCSHAATTQTHDTGDVDVVLPAAIIAYNEGGYSSTVLCLFCVMEGAAALAREEKKSHPDIIIP